MRSQPGVGVGGGKLSPPHALSWSGGRSNEGAARLGQRDPSRGRTRYSLLKFPTFLNRRNKLFGWRIREIKEWL